MSDGNKDIFELCARANKQTDQMHSPSGARVTRKTEAFTKRHNLLIRIQQGSYRSNWSTAKSNANERYRRYNSATTGIEYTSLLLKYGSHRSKTTAATTQQSVARQQRRQSSGTHGDNYEAVEIITRQS